MIEEGCRKSDEKPYLLAMKGHAYALLDDLAITKEITRELESRRKKEYIPEAYFTTLYHDIGDVENSAKWLEEAIRRHNTELVFMAIMPHYANIRKDDRVKSLLSIVGLSGR